MTSRRFETFYKPPKALAQSKLYFTIMILTARRFHISRTFSRTVTLNLFLLRTLERRFEHDLSPGRIRNLQTGKIPAARAGQQSCGTHSSSCRV